MIFGPLAPDKAKAGNPDILTVASGVYPMEDGYRPIGQFTTMFNALPSAAKGGAAFISPQGLSYILAGDVSSLYTTRNGGWLSIATGFSLLDESRWRFAQFGGLIITTNGTDAMRKIDTTTGVVSLLGGTPPRFETLAVVKDFLVGGVRNGNIMHMGWSGINDAEWWTTGQRQADRQVLPVGGRINGILSGEYGIILQRERICRMDYVGGNTVFQINEVSSNIGCVSVHSVAQWGVLGFFYSDEGWMMWDGQQPVPIGREWIDREFNALYSPRDWTKMSTAIDPVEGVLIVAMPDKAWGYSWIFKRWFNIPVVSGCLFAGAVQAITIDEDYAPDMPLDANIDGAALRSLDDTVFKGGEPLLYVFNAANQLGAFTGTPMAAILRGTDIELFKGGRADLRLARVETDAVAGMTLELLGRQRLGDAGTTKAFTTVAASGNMPIRASARYHRPTLTYAAGTPWSYTKAIEFDGKPGAGK